MQIVTRKNVFFNSIGSRTIRTEEAILIALAALDTKLDPNRQPKEFDLSHLIPQSDDTGSMQCIEFASKRKRKHAKAFDGNQTGEQTTGTTVDKIEAHNELATVHTQNDLSRFD